VAEHEPDVVGLSVVTFQRKTADGITDLVRTRRPRARVVVGGYDPSLAPEAYTEAPDGGVDFIVRGEGEITFRELLRALEAQRGYDHIAGLSYRSADGFRHNPARRVSGLEDGEIRPPRRDVRVLGGYTLLGRQVDVIETSRGCTFDCSFCSIIEMRGRNFHAYSFERVLADIRDARDRGARSLFIVDDNITLNVRRFEALCQAIIVPITIPSRSASSTAQATSVRQIGARRFLREHGLRRLRQSALRGGELAIRRCVAAVALLLEQYPWPFRWSFRSGSSLGKSGRRLSGDLRRCRCPAINRMSRTGWRNSSPARNGKRSRRRCGARAYAGC
jgi:radical SAM superfamily enzyme YgiQ (UPF0313 family)